MSNPIGERNLLVGILALHRSIIDLDALTVALRTWSESKSKGLAQILREQHTLSENHHALLEELVDDLLTKHGNDLHKSLAAVCLDGEPRQRLEAIADPELQAGLARVSSVPIQKLPDANVVEVVEEVTPIKMEPSRQTRVSTPQASREKSKRTPAWMLVAGGLAAGIVLAGAVLAVVSFAILNSMILHGENKNVAPIAQAHRIEPEAKPTEPPSSPQAPVEEKELVKPPTKDTVDDKKNVAPIKEFVEEKEIAKLPIKEPVQEKGPARPPIEEPAEIKENAKPAIVAKDLVPLDGFTSLFNGKDLTGWSSAKESPNEWRVENGILRCVIAKPTGGGRLTTEQVQPRNFHLRIEARTQKATANQVYFRSPGDGRQGFLCSIIGTGSDVPQVGGLMVIAPGKTAGIGRIKLRPVVKHGEWFTLEIIAEGNRFQTKVNGEAVSEAVSSEWPQAGRIDLVQAANLRSIEYRRIEIKELPEGPAPVPIAKAPEGPALAPIAQADGPPGFLLELPRPAERACLTADGLRVAYSVNKPGAFAYRETTELFNIEHMAEVKTVLTPMILLRSSPDGQRLALSADTEDGPKVLLWHWGTKSIERPLALGSLAVSGVFSADGRYLATYAPHHIGGKAKEHWLYVHDTGAMSVRQRLDGEPNFIGFWPDSTRVVVAVKGANVVQAWNLGNNAAVVLSFPAPTKPHSFARDFSKFTYIDQPNVLQVASAPSMRLEGKLNSKTPTLVFRAAALSVDHRYLLVGTEDTAPNPKFRGRAELYGLVAKVSKMRIDYIDGIPDHVELGANGIGLAQGANLRPCLYRLPIPPAPMIAKAPAVPVAAATGRFVPLFNGKDFTGWQAHAKRPGNWRVENGILIGSAAVGGSLYSARGDYQDFHLRAETRINDKGFGRVFFRAAYDPTKIPFKVLGYEVMINQRPVGAKTGSLTATSSLTTTSAPSLHEPAAIGDWSILEVVAKGEQITVLINGKKVAEFTDSARQFARSGHVALHQDSNAVIEFRKVEIKDLSAPQALPSAIPVPVKPAPVGDGDFPVTFNARSPGKWKVDGAELVQEVAQSEASMFFGDPKWTDYDFTVWAKRTTGNDHFALWFRRADETNSYIFVLGGQKNNLNMAARIKDRAILQKTLLPARENLVETDRWHVAKVSVRGGKAECFLDGAKLFEFTADKLSAGSIGLRTLNSAYRFKNIKVTAPDGKVLLEGLPKLPPAPPAPGEMGTGRRPPLAISSAVFLQLRRRP